MKDSTWTYSSFKQHKIVLGFVLLSILAADLRLGGYILVSYPGIAFVLWVGAHIVATGIYFVHRHDKRFLRPTEPGQFTSSSIGKGVPVIYPELERLPSDPESDEIFAILYNEFRDALNAVHWR